MEEMGEFNPESLHKAKLNIDEARKRPVHFVARQLPFADALQIAQSECRWNVVKPGIVASSEIDLERFGGMPENSLVRLQMLADQAAKYQTWDTATDRYNRHHKARTNWRKALPRRLGFVELISFFKSNQLSGNAIAALTSAANIAERGLTPQALAELDAPTSSQLQRSIAEIRGIVRDGFAQRYLTMSNRQKREVSQEVAGMAGEFLLVVNPKAVAD